MSRSMVKIYCSLILGFSVRETNSGSSFYPRRPQRDTNGFESRLKLDFAGVPSRCHDGLALCQAQNQLREVLLAKLPQAEVRRGEARIDFDGVVVAGITQDQIDANVSAQAVDGGDGLECKVDGAARQRFGQRQ